MAFTSEDTQIFKPGLGTIQIGNYTFTDSTTVGDIPIAGNITVFAVQLQSNNPNVPPSAKVQETFPLTGKTEIRLISPVTDFGTYMIYYI